MSPFGYKAAEKALSGGIQGLTSNVSQMLMQDYMRKQGEGETIRSEKRAWTQKQEEIALVFKNNKALAKVDADLRAENDENWRNDPYVKALQKRVGSGEATPEEQAIFEGSMEIMESQSQLTPLTEKQLDFIDQIRPQFPTIAIGLYDQELKRAQFAKEIDVDLQRINAVYGGQEATAARAEATAARAERTYRDKEHATLKKTSSDIAKQIYITKEKLAKEETEVEKWREKETGKRKVPKFKGEEKPMKRTEDFLREAETKKGVEPPNAAEIRNLRQQLKDLERKHTIAIEAIEGAVMQKAPQGVGAPQGVEEPDELVAGEIYEDEAGQRARYLGNGQWERF